MEDSLKCGVAGVGYLGGIMPDFLTFLPVGVGGNF